MASTEAQVAHVWRRLGFGPTPTAVADGVAAGGASAVIESILAVPNPPTTNWAWPGGPTNGDSLQNDATRLVELAATGASQLRERVAWILQGLLVVAWGENVGGAEMEAHLDNLRAWPQLSYRDLLEKVVRSNAMQWYLSGVGSAPPHANENLARELMELFSLGVTHPKTGANNYAETDIKEIARALTGYSYDWTTHVVSWQQANWDSGTKTFLGSDRGAAGVTEVIDAIASHSSFRYFVPRRLYRELVGIEPDVATLDALAAVWGPTGDIAGTVAAIVRRPEFLSDNAIRAKVKTPFELVVSTARTLGVSEFSHLGVWWVLYQMRQHPFLAPNVNGWPVGKAWLHAGTLVNWSGPVQWITFSDDGTDATAANFQLPTVRRLFAEGNNLNGGDLALQFAGLHDVSLPTLASMREFALGGPWNYARAASTMCLALQSPEFYVN
ncbi:MAG: DUF1800 family protein [Actinobacteria bacterium]|nr:DUF1800 family protein [Actinomycetota bacterium]MBV9255480.1 DUF1800 family protein [Actinomycetota bacterium]MBV9664811.1 DUF1800 family protein [Actinomycetota bacterium]MBV9935357.1 DUF1800 family protein [Actinomycetota bacterium]